MKEGMVVVQRENDGQLLDVLHRDEFALISKLTSMELLKVTALEVFVEENPDMIDMIQEDEMEFGRLHRDADLDFPHVEEVVPF